MITEDLKYKIAVTLIDGIGSITAKKIVAYSGSFEAVFKESKKNLLKIPGVGEHFAQCVIANKSAVDLAEKELDFIQSKKIKVLFYLDDEYPERLKNCADAPVVIYVKGNADLNPEKSISIVGTRNATPEGIDLCNKLIYDLSERGHKITIVSGLAYGIDIAAHKSALKNNFPTYAVLGHGLNTIYPSVHNSTAKEIIENGALISDFPSQCKMDKNNFIKRNRIIAGLADATIVVESGEKGGALVTADIANSYNRDVFAFPGRVSDNYSKGCNKLIKTNKAALIESALDLEYIMGWDTPNKKIQPKQMSLFPSLSIEEQSIVDILKENKELMIDQICMRLNMPTSLVSPYLLNLEFSGLVKSLPGKIYRLN